MSNALDIENKDINSFINLLHHGDLVEVYTDGSCMGNPGPGGWGAVFICNNYRSALSGFEEKTTNNRMELKGALEALIVLPQILINIHVYTDSEYVKNGITMWIHSWIKNNWRTQDNKPVKNQDLWAQLYELNESRNINWHWVKGHSNCINNENADFLAKSAILKNTKK
ncbi:MAG: ribonuclease HI [Alphaproteobacteria bacterium]|nr:ribonuclease HI [Alphaproteobacteria bacterium]